MFYQIMLGISLVCLIVDFVLIGMILNQHMKHKRFQNFLNRKMLEAVGREEEVEEEEE